MSKLNSWLSIGVGKKISAIAAPISEKEYLFEHFLSWSILLEKPLYFWTPAYSTIQKITTTEDTEERFKIIPTSKQVDTDSILSIISQVKISGIFLLFGLADKINIYNLDRCLLELTIKKNLVLIDETIFIPDAIASSIPIFELDPPDLMEVNSILLQNCLDYPDLDRIATACLGLYRGEIKNLICRSNSKILIEEIHKYKQSRLFSRGIEVFAKPPVPVATGMELLDKEILNASRLFSAQAKEFGLLPPRGWLFWGVPGTGKSLVAKLVANRLNATLISFDWSSAISGTVRESLANLDYVFKTCGSFGRCVLFLDEFDKAISDALESGGIASKLYRKLLVWMQEHRDPILTIATINYIEYLKPELVRRFDQVFFFDLPHNGTVYSTFKLYFEKFALSYSFSEIDWRKLLRAYRGCTQYEIARATENCAKRLFCSKRLPWTVYVEDLLEERTLFTAAADNPTLSDQIYDIKRYANYARSVAAPDTTIFAETPEEIHEIETADYEIY